MHNRGFRLYEITNDYKRAIDALLNSDEGSQIAIDEIKDNFDNKIIATAKYLKNIEAEYASVKAAADAMTARVKKLAGEMEYLENYMINNIQETGLAEAIKSPEFCVEVKSNPASLEILNADMIPDIYKVVKEVVSFDKNAIKKDIKDGFDVDGAKLVVKKRLVIK